MSLMKWFRKHNRKMLAVGVVVLMFVWLIPSTLRFSCRSAGPGGSKAVALFGKKEKITVSDIQQAHAELSILREIRADVLLRGRDVHGAALTELLFSESRTSPFLIASLRQAIRTSQLRISDEQILSMSNKTQTDAIYWHLLKKEAQAAGVAISNETAASLLGQIIPKLFDGTSYAQVINGFLGRGISEEAILSAFGHLYAVIDYASVICSEENLTRAQISWLVSDQFQTMDTQFVAVRAALFSDEQPQPGENQIKEHFDRYKTYYPGQVTQDNPFGFGYKLDDRVQLEYIIVKLDDIEKIIEQPTQQDKERYYLAHTSDFTEERPSDPNDPNSAPIQHTPSFGQVARRITSRMVNERITKKADAILAEAKHLAEEKYGDSDASDLTAKQLKDFAIDFGGIADKLAKENSMNVYSGATGLLSVLDVQSDANLAGLYLKPAGVGQMPYILPQLVFSVGDLGSKEPIPGDAPKPKLYETIGPLGDLQRKIAALVRVVDVKKSAEPNSIDFTFNWAKVKLGQSGPRQVGAGEEIYSVRKQVVKDLRMLAAMQTAKEKADQFLALAQKDDWDKALDQFNRQYPPAEPNEPNNFELARWTDLKKLSPDMTAAVTAQSQGLPGAHLSIDTHNRNKMILDALFSLVPEDSNSPKALPTVLEVKPDLSYYCIKSLSVNRIDRNEYDKSKALLAFGQDSIESQSLGVVHFAPENILKRMNFRVIKESGQQDEPNEPGAETAEPTGKT